MRTLAYNIAGRSAGDDRDMEEGDRSDVADIPRLHMNAQDMQGVLQGLSQVVGEGSDAAGNAACREDTRGGAENSYEPNTRVLPSVLKCCGQRQVAVLRLLVCTSVES